MSLFVNENLGVLQWQTSLNVEPKRPMHSRREANQSQDVATVSIPNTPKQDLVQGLGLGVKGSDTPNPKAISHHGTKDQQSRAGLNLQHPACDVRRDEHHRRS